MTLPVVCCLLALALLVAIATATSLRRRLTTSEAMVRQLEADLDAALRPPTPASPAERALRAVVGTAARVREQGVRQGVSSWLTASLDEVASWALDQRPDMLRVAAPDGSVALMFSDIVDSTSLNDKLGDKAWVRVLESHDQLVRGAVERRHGQVVKTGGDSFMVAFRDPRSAVLAARRIQRQLARTLDPRLRLNRIRVRIGVHCGVVVSRDGDYFGRNVAMAARVAALADGGEVLLTDDVREAVEGAEDARMRFEDLGSVELKGLPGEHRLWRLVVET
ncbi:adenylate/guanylate cyclase domain-containing protein [Nocardioides acrostichi]|uniref:Adenylate/guanylate cyclase domain-containing protein n=1 Tax=Nocardioides acrostichi TaxID=2784339 RepID=A0A930V316_9ACTN|nr:adenylate/guanylate cyclase domain-containing protein [Nocardioides acrostichi]MBF4162887.1 adenylate/guanylate cyclase domain-containing protein [Nocardioides acrostichi]